MTAPLLWFAAAFAAVAADEERGGHGVLARCRMRAEASDVDLFLGTGGEGHMHPGATLPFGMVQMAPSNGVQNRWTHCSGYHYDSTKLQGLTHTALSGTGLGDFGDLLLVPVCGSNEKPWPLDHDEECASPGLYAASTATGCGVEATATLRSGSTRVACPRRRRCGAKLDLDWGQNARTTAADLREANGLLVGSRTSAGFGRRGRGGAARAVRTTYFACEHDGASVDVSGRAALILAGHSEIYVRCALSLTSVEGATRNLAAEAAPGASPERRFAATLRRAEAAWAAELDRFHIAAVDAPGTALDVAFLPRLLRSTLYHALLAPNVVSDADGLAPAAFAAPPYYRRTYSTLSTWDTFRAAAPWLTFFAPLVAGDVANSMVRWSETHEGRLPKWLLGAAETDTMIGYHGVAIVADAFLKGLDVGGAAAAARAVERTVSDEARAEPAAAAHARNERLRSDVPEAVSTGLEVAVDDACAARLLARAGDRPRAAELRRRSRAFELYYDSKLGYFAGDSAGEDFDAREIHYAHRPRAHDFTEGSPLQYFFAPALVDVAGLARLLHPAKKRSADLLAARLDELFAPGAGVEDAAARDVTGCVKGSQYCHGNEVVHHAPFIYNALGRPWRTQEIVDDVLVGERLYGLGPGGLPGNDDVGQISAWLLFNALGLYPRDPCGGAYELGRPLVAAANVSFGGGRFLEIRAHGQAPAARYVAEARLDGARVRGTTVKHADLAGGRTTRHVLEFFMATERAPD